MADKFPMRSKGVEHSLAFLSCKMAEWGIELVTKSAQPYGLTL